MRSQHSASDSFACTDECTCDILLIAEAEKRVGSSGAESIWGRGKEFRRRRDSELPLLDVEKKSDNIAAAGRDPGLQCEIVTVVCLVRISTWISGSQSLSLN